MGPLVSAETTITAFAVAENSTAGPASERPCLQVLDLMAQVVAALAEERSRDGMLRVDDLKRILEMARGAGSPLLRAFEAQEARCRRAFRPAARHATSRNDVFRRLMVRPFETLLEGEPPAFPRCCLAHYFEVVEAAFGDKLAQYDQRSREIFQDMLVSHGNELAWDVFFNHARVRAVLARALSRLMGYIESPAGQWAWLTCMGRQNADGVKPSSDQAELILGTLRSTWKAMGPPERK
jgi:hypothetical protein